MEEAGTVYGWVAVNCVSPRRSAGRGGMGETEGAGCELAEESDGSEAEWRRGCIGRVSGSRSAARIRSLHSHP